MKLSRRNPCAYTFAVLGLLFCIAFVTGCQVLNSDEASPPGPSRRNSAVPLSALKLGLTEGCGQLKNYIVDALFEQYTKTDSFFCLSTDCAQDDGMIPAAPPVAPTGGGAAEDAPDDISQTNRQEEGVDEADLVKTDRDGNLYLVNDHFFVIEKGFPPNELSELSRLDLKVSASSLYLDEANKRVIIFGQTYEPAEVQAGGMSTMPFIGASLLQVIFIDVTNPAQPRIAERVSIEGHPLSNRRIEDRVHLIFKFEMQTPAGVRENPALRELVQRLQETRRLERSLGQIVFEESETVQELKRQIRSEIDKGVAETDVRSLLPRTHREIQGIRSDVDLLACGDIYLPEVRTDLGLLIVTSMNTDGSNRSTVAVMNNAWITYASKENLYVSQPSWGWFWGADQASQTAIYKFGLSEKKPVYLATGSIDGWALNQFSFSEHEGFLRAVTTENRFVRDTGQLEQKNRLFVLEDDKEGELRVAGEVEGFGPDESVRSVRFLKDRGFVVTFRQIDPLFAFDLSEPRQPKLVGELEIPGFSTYMHPMDDTHLLTIGYSASFNLQLQIFDISDMAKPALLHRYAPPGWSRSEAQFNHLAFTYYAPRNLLAIPVSLSWEPFNGIAAFSASAAEGFRELGRVNHADLTAQAFCTDIPPGDPTRAEQCRVGNVRWWTHLRRSVIMTSGEESYLYSISNVGVKATHIDRPNETLGSVIFPQS